uniref:Uncharacterized protein n=1 Tax=Arundo donax TaxID=35708 RepID=A0A0A9CMC4_ARUDO
MACEVLTTNLDNCIIFHDDYKQFHMVKYFFIYQLSKQIMFYWHGLLRQLYLQSEFLFS